MRGVGQALLTLGLVVLLFVVYEVWVSDGINQVKQSQLTQDLRQRWESGTDPLTAPARPDGGPAQLPLGAGFAFIRIPAFGLDYDRVILEGTDPSKLTEGPGHYPGTAFPGELGNFSMAGHRVGKGSPFLNLDLLRPGDAIIIETGQNWYVYRMLGVSDAAADPDGLVGREIVDPSAVQVVDPVPDRPGQIPTRRLLTLTTCNPKFSAAQRLVIHAEMDGPPLPKAQYPDGPPALSEG